MHATAAALAATLAFTLGASVGPAGSGAASSRAASCPSSASKAAPAPMTLGASFVPQPRRSHRWRPTNVVRLVSEHGGTILGVRITSSGQAQAYYDEGGFTDTLLVTGTGPSLFDGRVHDVAGVFTMPSQGVGSVELLVDGVSQGSDSGGAAWWIPDRYRLATGPLVVSSGGTTTTTSVRAETCTPAQ